MKNFIVLSVFILTMLLGLAISNPFNFLNLFENYLHRDCIRWDDESVKKPLFTLQEADNLIGKKVVSKNTNFRPSETGRIVSLEMVGGDKFLVEIYWGNGAEDENSSVTFHDKECFSRDFEIVD